MNKTTITVGPVKVIKRTTTCTNPRCKRCPSPGHPPKWYLQGVPGRSSIYLGQDPEGWEAIAADQFRDKLRGAQIVTLVSLPGAKKKRPPPLRVTARGRKRFTLFALRRKGLAELIERAEDGSTLWRRSNRGDWWVAFLRRRGGYGIQR